MAAKYLGLWYGGSSYAAPDGDDPRDHEFYDSIKAAGETLRARFDNDGGDTPCANEGDPCMDLYAGGEYHENGPDYRLTIGPRGGVVVSRG